MDEANDDDDYESSRVDADFVVGSDCCNATANAAAGQTRKQKTGSLREGASLCFVVHYDYESLIAPWRVDERKIRGGAELERSAEKCA